MRVLNQQDVPVDMFEAELGATLRAQGFHAAALVMLGQPPSGTAQLGGFWARFSMSEALGVWAMELMHVLANFDDLYPFGGNMGSFDEMAGARGTHPSAFTKSAIGWLDTTAVARHPNGQAANYQLHAIGLKQPPPSGRVRLPVRSCESARRSEPGPR
jgi:hypothetical protein